ncbi:SDR family oxidoreductase [Parvularcula marina]|uniref:NAD-dependent epimerase/dehydratase family protein n=1 Tax=Parvularcula marina TaxID=2292771 RepID=A0A371R7T8_9PROT|nr:SDR family oxidoreductase [Parvularcula marina]RFB01513.1 NAD-dependent epimerase/dehydratase family protein [Parvularcula marina]
MRVLVLGGYGLIGSSVTRRLLAAGHEVTGLGRDPGFGRRLIPEAAWFGADLRRMTASENWRDILSGVEAVVNAAGALQTGGQDDVSLVQEAAITAIIEACAEAGVSRFVQISAPGVSEKAETAFYRSKAGADAALKSSALEWTILKPGLVLSPQAYGGTSLLRMLAAFPWVQPIALDKSPVQTVHVNHVADAVLLAVEGGAVRIEADLVEEESHSLEDVVLAFRSWLGFSPPRAVIRVPRWLGGGVAKMADVAGHLGWRSPLRTTAMKVLDEGVRGDPAIWRAHTGREMSSLDASLRQLPSTIQERFYARMILLFPVLLLTFSVFWMVSGVIGLVRLEAASAVLAGAFPPALAKASVIGGGFADIAIGVSALFRRTVRGAAVAAIMLSLGYLAAATLFVPELWGDPMGPLVKIFPSLALALTVFVLTEKR